MALPVNGSTHLIPAYCSFYRPRNDERLSWPSWLTYSWWLTHISGHPSAAGRAQDRESSPAKDRRSTTVPRHQVRDEDRLKFYQITVSVLGLLASSRTLSSVSKGSDASRSDADCRHIKTPPPHPKRVATPLPCEISVFKKLPFLRSKWSKLLCKT